MDTFNAFSPGNKKGYVKWETEAKTEATRQKRLKTASEMDGRKQNQELEVFKKLRKVTLYSVFLISKDFHTIV